MIVRVLGDDCMLVRALDEGCASVKALDEGCALVWALDEGCSLVRALDGWALMRVFSDCLLAIMLGGHVPVGALDAEMFLVKTLLHKTSLRLVRGGGSGGMDSFQTSGSCLHSVNSGYAVGCSGILVGLFKACGKE